MPLNILILLLVLLVIVLMIIIGIYGEEPEYTDEEKEQRSCTCKKAHDNYKGLKK